jgi:hypothetical protein
MNLKKNTYNSNGTEAEEAGVVMTGTWLLHCSVLEQDEARQVALRSRINRSRRAINHVE